MASTIRHFQDELTVDAGLPARLGASGGQTLVIGARLMHLEALTFGFDYVLAADQLTVADDAVLAVTGGPAIGVFLQVTAASAADLAIPDRPFTFGELISAQAAGDAQVLSEHGRPVLRLHLADRAAGVKQLQELVTSLAGQAASSTES